MIDEKSSYFCVEEKTSRKRHYEPSNLLNDLVKRRKLELDNNEQPTPMENPQSDRLTEACEKNDDAIKKKASLKAEQRTVKLNGKGFSITGAVSDLIDLNSGTANVKIERDLDFQRLKEKEISICNKDEMKCEQKPWHASLISLAMPSPDIPLASNRQSFILSLSVFKQRQLIRHIREHLPQARLVERAFNSDTALSKEQKAMTQDDNTNEANILISSNTGLIWTTLQKIKQRSLPGQKAQSPTKEKLKMLSAKYENLIILISKNNISNKESESHCVLDESDCEAMADIHGFGAQLDCHLTVYFVPGEGTDLFKWITAVMGKYGIFNEGSVNLLEDESMWELFLRFAGLNAFAAQGVLHHVKQQLNTETESIRLYSRSSHYSPNVDRELVEKLELYAIVMMSEEERIRLFEPLLGGRRTLQKFGEIVDIAWTDSPYL